MFARACNAAQQGGVFAKVVVLEALPRCKCPVIMRQKIADKVVYQPTSTSPSALLDNNNNTSQANPIPFFQ